MEQSQRTSANAVPHAGTAPCRASGDLRTTLHSELEPEGSRAADYSVLFDM